MASTGRQIASRAITLVFRAVHAIATVFGVEDFKVYQSHRGLVSLETTEPVSICVGSDLVRRFSVRDRSPLGRGVLGLSDKTALLGRLSTEHAGDVLAIRN